MCTYLERIPPKSLDWKWFPPRRDERTNTRQLWAALFTALLEGTGVPQSCKQQHRNRGGAQLPTHIKLIFTLFSYQVHCCKNRRDEVPWRWFTRMAEQGKEKCQIPVLLFNVHLCSVSKLLPCSGFVGEFVVMAVKTLLLLFYTFFVRV